MALRAELENWVRQTVGVAVSRTLASTPLTPTTLTIMGLAITLVAAICIATGWLFWGGCIVLVAGAFDMLDGALARAKDLATPAGAFLDSVLDRYSDILLFAGIFVFLLRTSAASTDAMLVFAAVIGTLLTSYIRARAEAVGFTCKVGLLERPERIIVLALGLITGWLSVALWLLAIFANITALQRLFHVLHQARTQQ